MSSALRMGLPHGAPAQYRYVGAAKTAQTAETPPPQVTASPPP